MPKDARTGQAALIERMEERRKAESWDRWCQFAKDHGGVLYVGFADGSSLVNHEIPNPDAPCTCGLPDREHYVPDPMRLP